MSTYIQGVTDYIPQIQEFQPDYNFYNQVLQFKQGKYDAARKQIEDVYSSMLNNPMLREEDIQKREQYFKIIKDDIKRISGLDLSLKQNAQAASDIFTDLLDDQNIAHDMAFTKQAQNALAVGESLRSRGDDGYWSGMEQLIQMDMKKYQDSSNEQALNMSAPKYVKAVNINKELIPMLKDLKFDVTMERTWDYVYDENGQPIMNDDGSFKQQESNWIIKQKNGSLVEPYLQALLQGYFGNRGDINDYYTQLARYNRMQFAYQYADQFGSVEQANQYYIDAYKNALKENISSVNNDIQQVYNNTLDKLSALKEDASNTSDQGAYQRMQDLIGEYSKMLDDVEQSKEYYNTVANISEQEDAYYEQSFDSLFGNILLSNDINMAAKIASMNGSEVTYRPNEFKRDYLNHVYRMDEAKYKSDLDFERFQKEFPYKLQLEQLKHQKTAAAVDNTIYSVPLGTIPGGFVGEDYDADDPEYQKMIMEGLTEFLGESANIPDLISAQTEVSNATIEHLKRVADGKGNDALDAQRMLVDIAEMQLMQLGEDGEETVKKNRKNSNNSISSLYNSYKNQNIKVDNNTSPFQLQTIYQKLLPIAKNNEDLYNNYSSKIDYIDALDNAFEEAQSAFGKAASHVISQITDEERKKIAKAYMGIAPNKNKEWDGKFVSYSNYLDLCRQYGISDSKAAKYWSTEYEDGGVFSKESIQYTLSSLLANVDSRSEFAKYYGYFQGFGGVMSRPITSFVSNSSQSQHREPVMDIMNQALSNIDIKSGNVVISDGEIKSDVPKESDEDCVNALRSYLASLSYVDDKNPKFQMQFTYSNTAGKNKDIAMLKIAPSIKEAKSQSNKDSFDTIKNGICIYFDKSIIKNNSLVNASKSDFVEAKLYFSDTAYKIPVGPSEKKCVVSDPNIQKIKDSQGNVGYKVNGKLKYKKSDGKEYYIDLSQHLKTSDKRPGEIYNCVKDLMVNCSNTY